MPYSLTVSESTTFTVTHARHLAAKVATDLKRMQRFYGSPTDSKIADFEAEAIALVKADFLDYVWYGFKRNGYWIEPTLKYTSQDLYSGSADDDPGKIRPGADITGASFYSYLVYNGAWELLTGDEQDAFERGLPFFRRGAGEPTVSGYLSTDRTYSSGGRALERATVRGN